jgi:hypothetical protein
MVPKRALMGSFRACEVSLGTVLPIDSMKVDGGPDCPSLGRTFTSKETTDAINAPKDLCPVPYHHPR